MIVANKGASVGLMSEKFMTPLVIMVVFTTIVTPILLKFVFPKKKDNSGETPSGELAGLEKAVSIPVWKNPKAIPHKFDVLTETI